MAPTRGALEMLPLTRSALRDRTRPLRGDAGAALARVSFSFRRPVTLPPLAVSSDEVVVVLQRAGFTLAKRARDALVLTHGVRDVIVPVGPIGEEPLRQLLRTAGISYSEFVDLLEAADIASPALRVRAFAE